MEFSQIPHQIPCESALKEKKGTISKKERGIQKGKFFLPTNPDGPAFKIHLSIQVLEHDLRDLWRQGARARARELDLTARGRELRI